MIYRVRRQSGLTLVELMIATTLSLVLLAGVLMVFTANKSTYRLQNGMGTLQENGRYAVRQIGSDLQMAGFGGCLSPKFTPRIAMLVSSGGRPAYLNEVNGFPAGNFFAGVNNDSSSTAYGSVTMAAGTDSIEIRGALQSDVRFVTGETLTTGNVSTIGTGTGFAADDILMISDCAGADIFQATSVATASGNTQIGHGSAKNIQGNLSRLYGADSVVTELASHTYFVADTNRNNPAGQDILALYRFDGTTARELVDGVEDLQIEYALDTDDDGVVDAFADPGGVTNWNEVMAVRISLLLNSVDGASSVEAPYNYSPSGTSAITPTSGDLRLRQEFTAMVAVRNNVL
jgi:type IV pilus assembly protein PilW